LTSSHCVFFQCCIICNGIRDNGDKFIIIKLIIYLLPQMD
jgi:hypothetical protein